MRAWPRSMRSTLRLLDARRPSAKFATSRTAAATRPPTRSPSRGGVPSARRTGPRRRRMTEVKSYLEALMTLDEAPLKLDPGQVVFSAGDAGREMFIVRTGSVDLRIGDTLLETVAQGGIFGELA